MLEILPGEMGKIMIPVLDEISADTRDKLLREVDKIVREEGNIEEALDLVD